MIILALIAVLLASPAMATVRYADNTLGANCTSGNYSIASRNCTGSDGNAYNTLAGVITPTVAGDTIYIRDGVWDGQIDLQAGNKSGTAGNYITIAGYPGETVIIRYTNPAIDSYGPIKARGNRGYFIFQDLELDGVNLGNKSGWSIRESNHHFIVRRVKMYNFDATELYIGANASDVLVEDSEFRDGISTCVSTQRHYGIYVHDGTRITIRRNTLYNNPGGGMQVYPGPLSSVVIQNNYIHHTNFCASSPVGGITIGTDDNDSTSGSVNNVEVTGNIIASVNEHTNGTVSGIGAGIRVFNNSASAFTTKTVSGTKIYNNTIYRTRDNPATASTELCVNIATGALNTVVRNNIMTDCGIAAYANSGAGTVASHNACTSAENCPTTSKLTITAITSCTPSTTDFTQKAGSSCIDRGTDVGRAFNGSAPDIGALETLVFASCEVPSGSASTIRVTFTNNLAPPLLPATGATTFTARQNGSSNTVSGSVNRVGDNLYDIPVSSAYASGHSVDISGSTWNITDSSKIGGTINQPYVGTLTNQACTNNATGAPSFTFTQAAYRYHGVYGQEASPDIRLVENVANFQVVKGGAFRVRLSLVCGVSLCPSTGFFLYYSTGGPYALIPDTFDSDNIAFCGATYAGNIPPNGAPTTSQLSTSGTFIPGAVVFTASAIPTIDGLAPGYKTELEYCVKFDEDATGSYSLILKQQDGTAVDFYTRIPTVQAVSPMYTTVFR